MKREIDATVSPEDLAAILEGLRYIDTLLPFTINLTPAERRDIPKMGKKSLAFVEGALGYADKHRTLLPAFTSYDFLKRSFNLALALRSIEELLGPLAEKVNDTLFAVGAQAYAGTRAFYSNVKVASQNGVPGSDVIAQDLGERFKMTRKPKTDQPVDPVTTVTPPPISPA